MKELRAAYIHQVLTELDRSLLTKHAFETSFNGPDGVIFNISYKDNPNYHFVITFEEANRRWRLTECPGPIFTEPEETHFATFLDCRNRMGNWVQRLLEELRVGNGATDIKTALEEMRARINDFADQVPDPDVPFTREEASSFTPKLDEFVRQVQEKLENQNGVINQLKADVEALKKEIRTVPKKTFIRAVGSKLSNVIEKIVINLGVEAFEHTEIAQSVIGLITGGETGV